RYKMGQITMNIPWWMMNRSDFSLYKTYTYVSTLNKHIAKGILDEQARHWVNRSKTTRGGIMNSGSLIFLILCYAIIHMISLINKSIFNLDSGRAVARHWVNYKKIILGATHIRPMIVSREQETMQQGLHAIMHMNEKWVLQNFWIICHKRFILSLAIIIICYNQFTNFIIIKGFKNWSLSHSLNLLLIYLDHLLCVYVIDFISFKITWDLYYLRTISVLVAGNIFLYVALTIILINIPILSYSLFT
ncbi:hypothetical protein ACJX0J_042158, partial [Zea mays]